MSVRSWENLNIFVDPDDFGDAVMLRLLDGTVRAVHGVFDEPYLNAELGEYELDTARPRLTCKWSDVQDVKRGDTCEIDGRLYDVMTNAQSDGTGMAVLELALRIGHD